MFSTFIHTRHIIIFLILFKETGVEEGYKNVKKQWT